MKVPFLSLVAAIPIIHGLANVTTNYFPPGTLNPGSIRAIFMFVIVVLFLLYRSKQFIVLWYVVSAFLLYNALLISFAGGLSVTIANYIKIALPLVLIFLGASAIRSRSSMHVMFKVYIVSLAIFIVNYVFANIIGLGGSYYLDDSFYSGGARAGTPNELALLAMIAIAYASITNDRRVQWFSIVSFSIAVIIIVLVLRRGAIIALVMGLLVYVIVGGVSKRALRMTVVIGAMLIAAYPLYSGTLNDRYQARVDAREGSIANYQIEARFSEFERVPKALTADGAWLFGTHNLASQTYFHGRELHVGYMAILHGSGIIGVILFGFVVLSLVISVRRLYRRCPRKRSVDRVLYALFWCIISMLLAYLVTSRLHSFSFTVPAFLMIGVILGWFKVRLLE